MHCPKCGENVNVLTAKSSGFSCGSCGAYLAVSGGLLTHVFALALFVVEATVLFSFVREMWIAVVAICVLGIANYYVGFRIFLRITLGDGDR